MLAACGDGEAADAGASPPGPSCATTAAAPGTTAALLPPILERARAGHGLRAVIFSATVGGQPILTTALGESRSGVPATADMHFRVGMPAEQFAATLMLRAAEEGRLSLDAPVSDWFPDYPNAARATVRMLAASSAGFGDYVFAPGDPARGVPSFDTELYADVRREFTTAELIARSQPPYQVPQFDNPGADWRYSHTGFAMLGAILEAAYGTDYEALLSSRILRPLGLANTAYAAGTGIQAPVLHAFTSERGRYEDATDWNPSWTSFSGRPNSDVCDLATWARAFGTGRLLEPGSAAQLTAPVNVGLGANRPERYFGLGVIVNNGWLSGDANFFGWHTATAYFPTKDIAMAVTWTEGPDTTDASHVSGRLLREISMVLAPEAPMVGP